MTYKNEENEANNLLNPSEPTEQNAVASAASEKEKKDDEPALWLCVLYLLAAVCFCVGAWQVGASGIGWIVGFFKSPFACQIDDAGVTIVKYRGKRSRVVVPAEIEGRPVVAIGDGAFVDCDSLTSVSLPNGLQSVGDKAFMRCGSLTSVSFPDGLQSVGDSAFYGCSAELTLNGAADSVAEEYARENDIRFKVRTENAASDATKSEP